MEGLCSPPLPASGRRRQLAGSVMADTTSQRSCDSPRRVHQLQGGWARIASKKLSRVPVSHLDTFLNRKIILFFWDVREEIFSAHVL